MKLAKKIGLLSTLSVLLLAGCGGGDSVVANNSTPMLSGTAAVGLPIVGGHVNVVCAGGSALSTTTLSTGAWQVTTSGQTLPCAVQVSGGTVNGSANSTPYHSIAISFGTVNITPLTDLVVAHLAGNTPATWFTGLNAAGLQAVTSAKVTTALSNVNTALGLTATLNGANPLTSVFTASHGNLLDDILEALAAAGSNHAALLGLATQTSFSAPAGFNFANAYASVVASHNAGGGGTTPTCAAGETVLTYSGNPPYTNGQQLCFSASPTALSFSGKTLTNPTVNSAVSAPFSALLFSDAGYIYEVILNAGALYEINVSNAGHTYLGQFVIPAPANTGAANLQVQVSATGLSLTIPVSNAPVPSSQADFCNGINSDSTFAGIGTSGGGTLSITGCTFANKVGHITANLSITGLGITIPYVITYTYQ
ncbi:hypothetical protein MIZ03_1055 [Rhodoferax lithotrophicus]|uniref:Lipoprotein n=1 Tax=Rhodoferax lithotrophicus TaxID=2798804 RepID=A0ABM7MJ32_9BURK|nr:hypothetical protein MIZ03_1055 [Rhodoferax sp. MIZ03]